ncbi:putative secreted antimicrobial peptide [Aspergillus clavatus NRRL 1]|uniref:Secreted antimicrobial peptide, putative n=1 Tax=Aspergillus clavatus (strain ATCC 1007 / CBS 513.65 / DSM 816 / NCTC 3887 / NRRL 1 / QM 1276 / 107) TaxID=344612 RepID=A1C8X8_ASPCL|nr:secreted antimicrobial peptide, putative [Aspergillus clavatus NRRL 1]EAW13765.1 secreted antimicrobial peptide, putative [Aspergillus clavatus NRRL 1]
MKFLAIANLLASASATIVYPYTSASCGVSTVGKITSCGCTNMGANYKITGAKLDFQKATAPFYQGKDCKGAFISKALDQSCVELPVGWSSFGSVKIHGGTC